MVNDVPVPHNIDLMIPSMAPVKCKVYTYESNNIEEYRRFNIKNSPMIVHPFIADDDNTKLKDGFEVIGHSRAIPDIASNVL